MKRVRKNRAARMAAAALPGLAAGAFCATSVAQPVRVDEVTVFGDPRGDYGDAPDGTNALYLTPFQNVIGHFPTRFNTTNSRYGKPGGHTKDVAKIRLGSIISAERGPRDTTDPDTVENLVNDDFDDGWVSGPCLTTTPPAPWPGVVDATLRFRVFLPAGLAAGTYRMNVLIDKNHDGQWSNSPGNTEWIVVDQVVNVSPGTSQDVTVGPLPWPVSPAASWMRVAVTSTPVVGSFTDNGTGWDGSGMFPAGEIEDHLLTGAASALAYASAAASAAANASDFAFSASESEALAWPADANVIIAMDLGVYAGAMSSARADAEAHASASATAQASASASATACATAVATAQTSAMAVAAACISCPCATLCAAAGVSATAAVEAATQAYASANVSASAAATAYAQASARATAIASAQVEMTTHVSVVAQARASAVAYANAYSTALALANANSTAAASAAAVAVAAACAGDADAAASAAANAAAYAHATATALTDAQTYAYAAASAWASVRVTIEIMVRTRELAIAYASWSAYASSSASASASAAAYARASAEAAAATLTSAFAMVAGTCSGECCMVCTPGGDDHTTAPPDRFRNGISGSVSVRAGVSVSTWTLVHARASAAAITGFTWQTMEAGVSGWMGMADVAIWDSNMVTSGQANEFNTMMRLDNVPATRHPVLDECGRPVQQMGRPVFEYTVNLPQPMSMPQGFNYHFSVRAVGSPTQQSSLVSSYRDESTPTLPSYYLSPTSGYTQAVPISQVSDCDHDFVAYSLSNSGLQSPGGHGRPTDEIELPLDPSQGTPQTGNKEVTR